MDHFRITWKSPATIIYRVRWFPRWFWKNDLNIHVLASAVESQFKDPALLSLAYNSVATYGHTQSCHVLKNFFILGINIIHSPFFFFWCRKEIENIQFFGQWGLLQETYSIIRIFPPSFCLSASLLQLLFNIEVCYFVQFTFIYEHL